MFDDSIGLPEGGRAKAYVQPIETSPNLGKYGIKPALPATTRSPTA